MDPQESYSHEVDPDPDYALGVEKATVSQAAGKCSYRKSEEKKSSEDYQVKGDRVMIQ